jgi:photosystem II stability/assembly factor-like uncharacterized protein
MRSHRTRIAARWLMAGTALVLLGAGGCKKKSGGPGTGGGGGAWLVGERGTMENLLPDGTLGEGYALDVDHDLLAITCRGLDTAFVAGEEGTLPRTFDGGATWTSIDLGTRAALRGVAAGSPDHVSVAGDGLLAVSRDSGDHWSALPAPAADWRSVAADHSGGAALAVAADGGVWRWDDARRALSPVAAAGAGARAVALSHDGQHAAVVGDAGLVLRSGDGGRTWRDVATGSGADLLAAWVTRTGDLVAVGRAGTLVRVEGDEVEVSQPGVGTLRAVHLEASGDGLAGGDAGELLRTRDGGRTWEPVDVAIRGTLFGLDAVEGHGHL